MNLIRRPWFEALALFGGFSVLVYVCLGLRGGLSEPDTLYHFKIASLIMRTGPWVDIRWLPFTVLREHGPDHHWLWHVFLAPFTLIPSPWEALRIAAAVTCGLVPATVLVVCRSLAVPYAPVFAILATAGHAAMPERLTRLRSENVAFIMLSLALLCMARKRYVALAIVSFIFMASYHGAILLIPMAAVYTLASVSEGWPPRLWNLIAVLGGIAAGLIINPWFPANIDYLLFHTLFKLQSANAALIGSEWYVPVPLQIAKTSWLIHLLVGAAVLSFAAKRRWLDSSLSLSVESIAALLLTAMGLLMYSQAWRYAAYYALFGVLAAALVWRDLAIRLDRRPLALTVGALSTLACVATLGVGARELAQMPFYHHPLTRYGAIARYLEAHTKTGDIVYNADWSDFSLLIWQSDRLRYVNGLDGNYLAYGDPRRFKIWYDFYRGLPIEGGTSKTLRSEFNTEWLLLPRSDRMDAIAMRVLDEGDAQSAVLDGDGWLIHLGGEGNPSAAPPQDGDA